MADTAGDSDSRATAKWPADTGDFMMERETVVVGLAWEQPGTTTPRAPSPRERRYPRPATTTRSGPENSCSTPENSVCSDRVGEQTVRTKTWHGVCWGSPYYWPATKNQARAKWALRKKIRRRPDEQNTGRAGGCRGSIIALKACRVRRRSRKQTERASFGWKASVVAEETGWVNEGPTWLLSGKQDAAVIGRRLECKRPGRF